MSNNRQLQTIQGRNNYALAQYSRPRGVVGQVWMGILRPGAFFSTLPSLAETRTWVWAGALILALVAFSAIRQASLGTTSSLDNFTPPTTDPSEFDTFGGELGGIPPTGTNTTAATDVNKTWSIGLIAASHVIFGWVVLTALLIPVSLFNGRKPRLGKNWQIAIWASLPLAVMAALQLVYYSAGGKIGAAGLSGLLAEWEFYNSASEPARSLLYALASYLTIFWLWSLALVFIGARNALNGKWWAVTLVVILWAVTLVIAPVLTGAIKAPAQPLPQAISDPLGSPEMDPASLGFDPMANPEANFDPNLPQFAAPNTGG